MFNNIVSTVARNAAPVVLTAGKTVAVATAYIALSVGTALTTVAVMEGVAIGAQKICKNLAIRRGRRDAEKTVLAAYQTMTPAEQQRFMDWYRAGETNTAAA